MCTLATILQFTVSHHIVLFPYLYPQHFGCKMCIDQPTSWLSSCTAKTSHLALNQRRLSSCQDSSFHTEMFASAECIWFMFQINHLPKKHAFYRRQISKKGFFFFYVYGGTGQCHANQSKTTCGATMRGRSLYDITFTILNAPRQLSHTSDCLNTPLPLCERSAGIYTFWHPTTPCGKPGHKRCRKGDSLCVRARVCVHSTACVCPLRAVKEDFTLVSIVEI